MSVLQFDCHYRYKTGFSLQLALEAEAEITALVGPSGSGKTTTLNLIAGLLQPKQGRIQLNGRTLFDSESKQNLPPEDRRIGFVFQDYQLFPHLTVAENLKYGQARCREGRFEFGHVVDVLELGSLQHRFPATLSGGQRQRTALGRAILRGAELLLLDEPLSALDDDLRDSITGFLQRVIGEYKIPTLLVTHDARSIEKLAQRTISLPRPMAVVQNGTR